MESTDNLTDPARGDRSFPEGDPGTLSNVEMIVRELARAKVAFQLRAIETIIRGPAQGTDAQRAETVKHGSVHDGPVAESNAPSPRDTQGG